MTQPPSQRARDAVDAIFADLRDRKFLKYLFAEDPEHCGAYGYVETPLDRAVQEEIAEAWRAIFASFEANLKAEMVARVEPLSAIMLELRRLIHPLTQQGEDRIWRPAEKSCALIDKAEEALAVIKQESGDV